MSLTRTVRFSINDPFNDAIGSSPNSTASQPSGGGYSGIPMLAGFGRYYELEVRCVGEVHPVYSYLVDIKEIDRAAREIVVPALTQSAVSQAGGVGDADPALALRDVVPKLGLGLSGMVANVRLRLSPYYSLEMAALSDNPQGAKPSAVLLRRKYDFAAAHRLHVPTLSDAENARLFGKCNNPRGHGHNYQVEPCVSIAFPATGAPRFTAAALDTLVAREILDRFDHKHLNDDTTQFATASGLNPSVENIARVFFEILAPVIQAAGAELRDITVWETDRTSSTFPG